MPLFSFSLAFLTGIVLASALKGSAAGWAGAALASALIALLGRRRPGLLRFLPQRLRLLPFARNLQRLAAGLPAPMPVLLIFVFAGAARFQAAQTNLHPGFIAWHNAGEAALAPAVDVQGTLTRPPDERDRYTNLYLQAEGLRRAGEAEFQPISGLLLARAAAGPAWHYGDRVIVHGVLEQPPHDAGFSYRDYLARRGVHSYMAWAEVELVRVGEGSPWYSWIAALKKNALQTVALLYPEPEASLLSGILLGVEAGIPAPVQRAFKATGTSHIVAISGFNMAIVAGLFSTLFGRLLGRRGGFLAAAAAITVYTVLVGANAAVVRAAIMGGLALFARQVGRRQDGLTALAFSGALMAVFNPLLLWEVGFQLSFMATLGLVLYAQPLADWFSGVAGRMIPVNRARQLSGPVGEYVLFTFAAQITTLPVLVYHFGRISLVSLIANPFILPAQPAVMILGGLAVLLGLAWLPLGKLAAWFAWPFVAYTIRVVEGFARLPGGEIVLGDVPLALAVIYCGLLFGWTFARSHVENFGRQLRPGLVFGGLALLTTVVWRGVLSVPDGRLHLVVLEVSTQTVSGEALLIHTPEGRTLLVSGGPAASLLGDALGRRLPFAGSGLDWLIVAAPGEEHIAALPRVLERYPPGQVLWAGAHNASRSSQLLYSELTRLEVPVLEARPGQVLDLGRGAELKVLTVGKRGAVLLLEWESFRAVLPVGVSWDDLPELKKLDEVRDASVLLLANGGYALTNPPEWIEWVHPEVTLLSVASGDRRGLPSQSTLDALEGYSLLRTDRDGWIELSTDGEQMWVEVER
jgi:competence protein ComEC